MRKSPTLIIQKYTPLQTFGKKSSKGGFAFALKSIMIRNEEMKEYTLNSTNIRDEIVKLLPYIHIFFFVFFIVNRFN